MILNARARMAHHQMNANFVAVKVNTLIAGISVGAVALQDCIKFSEHLCFCKRNCSKQVLLYTHIVVFLRTAILSTEGSSPSRYSIMRSSSARRSLLDQLCMIKLSIFLHIPQEYL